MSNQEACKKLAKEYGINIIEANDTINPLDIDYINSVDEKLVKNMQNQVSRHEDLPSPEELVQHILKELSK